MNVNMSKYIFKIFVLLGHFFDPIDYPTRDCTVGPFGEKRLCRVLRYCVIVVPPPTNFAVGSLSVFFLFVLKEIHGS